MKSSRRKEGFTLLEILIVAAIIGVVMTLGTSTFIVVTGAWNERRAITELDDQARTAFESIRQDVDAALSFELSTVSVLGASSTVTDDSSYPPANYPDDELVIAIDDQSPMKVAYRVERTGATGLLMRTSGGLSADSPAGATLQVINAKVQGFSVEYLGREYGTGWSETWTGPGLPSAVRIGISLEHPVRRQFQIARKVVYPIHVQ